MPPATSTEPSRSVLDARRWMLVFVVLGIGYGLGAAAAWSFFGADAGGRAFFPPAGLTFAALVILRGADRSAVVAAILAAELLVGSAHGLSLGMSLGWAVVGTVEPFVGVAALRWLAGGSVDLTRRSGLGSFLIAGTVVGPAVGGILGATLLLIENGDVSWLLTAVQVWTGDGLGVLIVASALFILRWTTLFGDRSRRLETVGLVTLAALASGAAFWLLRIPPATFIVPLLLITALRFGIEGVALVSLIVAGIANAATAHGHGPFATADDFSPSTQLTITQLFLAAMVLSAWFLAIESSERSSAQRRVQSEARLRTIFSSIDEGFCLCEMLVDDAGEPYDYRFVEVNPLFEQMTGLVSPSGRTALQLVPDLEPFWIQTYGRAAFGTEPIRFEQGSAAMGRVFDVFCVPVSPLGSFALVFRDVTEARRASEAAEQARTERESAAARAVQRARTQARRSDLLADVTARLEAFEPTKSRARRLVELLVPRLADAATVFTDDEGERHVVAHLDAEGLAPDLVSGLVSSDARRRVEVRLALGDGVAAHLALVRREGFEDGWFTGDDFSFVSYLADRAGVVMASEAVKEREHRIALRLQRALLPDRLARSEAMEISARYVAASNELDVGGDWYDCIQLNDGRILLVVGDVVGHGLDAAVTMGRLRAGLAALANLYPSPGPILSALDDFARQLRGATNYTTIFCAIMNPATGALRYASAGHPPMFLVDPAGRVEWLGDGRSPPLCTLPVESRPEGEVTLTPGTLLVMYTDGLIERRDEAISEGLERLARLAAGVRHESTEEACELLLDRSGDDRPESHRTHDDDVVLVILRFCPADRLFHLDFPADAGELAGMRDRVKAWLEEQRASAKSTHDVLLAVGEACANVVEHAYATGERGSVDVRLFRQDDDHLLVVVRDSGVWIEPAISPAHGGRGNGIIDSLSHRTQRDAGEAGTVVTMELHLEGAASG